jgi:hypothetical protein
MSHPSVSVILLPTLWPAVSSMVAPAIQRPPFGFSAETTSAHTVALRTGVGEGDGNGVGNGAMSEAHAVASRFKTSLRATTIRLIELGLATWDLYEQIPVAANPKRGGGLA